MLKTTTKRVELIDNYIFDAQICHGAFGLSQIYGRLYNRYNICDFYISSQYWKKQGIKMAKYSKLGHIYFPIYHREEKWPGSINLLEGLSGIGLCLISHLTNFETKWDESFFIT
ncbi:MAG: lanthionine synthetase LanC family protein [Saprospiraceae bacterium]